MELEAFVEGLDCLPSVKAFAEVALDSVDSSVLAGQVLSQDMFGAIFASDVGFRMQGRLVAEFPVVSTERAMATGEAARVIGSR